MLRVLSVSPQEQAPTHSLYLDARQQQLLQRVKDSLERINGYLDFRKNAQFHHTILEKTIAEVQQLEQQENNGQSVIKLEEIEGGVLFMFCRVSKKNQRNLFNLSERLRQNFPKYGIEKGQANINGCMWWYWAIPENPASLNQKSVQVARNRIQKKRKSSRGPSGHRNANGVSDDENDPEEDEHDDDESEMHESSHFPSPFSTSATNSDPHQAPKPSFDSTAFKAASVNAPPYSGLFQQGAPSSVQAFPLPAFPQSNTPKFHMVKKEPLPTFDATSVIRPKKRKKSDDAPSGNQLQSWTWMPETCDDPARRKQMPGQKSLNGDANQFRTWTPMPFNETRYPVQKFYRLVLRANGYDNAFQVSVTSFAQLREEVQHIFPVYRGTPFLILRDVSPQQGAHAEANPSMTMFVDSANHSLVEVVQEGKFMELCDGETLRIIEHRERAASNLEIKLKRIKPHYHTLKFNSDGAPKYKSHERYLDGSGLGIPHYVKVQHMERADINFTVVPHYADEGNVDFHTPAQMDIGTYKMFTVSSIGASNWLPYYVIGEGNPSPQPNAILQQVSEAPPEYTGGMEPAMFSNNDTIIDQSTFDNMFDVDDLFANMMAYSVSTPDVDKTNTKLSLPLGRTPLHFSAAFGSLKWTTRFVKEYSLDPFTRDDKGKTSFWMAVQGGHESVVRYFLSLYSDEKALDLAITADYDNVTPLHIAVLNGHAHLLPLLPVMKMIHIRVHATRETPIFYAALLGNLPCLQFLTDKIAQDGGDLRACLVEENHNGENALHAAAQNNRIDAVYFLHACAAKTTVPLSILCRNKDGMTPYAWLEYHHQRQMGREPVFCGDMLSSLPYSLVQNIKAMLSPKECKAISCLSLKHYLAPLYKKADNFMPCYIRRTVRNALPVDSEEESDSEVSLSKSAHIPPPKHWKLAKSRSESQLRIRSPPSPDRDESSCEYDSAPESLSSSRRHEPPVPAVTASTPDALHHTIDVERDQPHGERGQRRDERPRDPPRRLQPVSRPLSKVSVMTLAALTVLINLVFTVATLYVVIAFWYSPLPYHHDDSHLLYKANNFNNIRPSPSQADMIIPVGHKIRMGIGGESPGLSVSFPKGRQPSSSCNPLLDDSCQHRSENSRKTKVGVITPDGRFNDAINELCTPETLHRLQKTAVGVVKHSGMTQDLSAFAWSSQLTDSSMDNAVCTRTLFETLHPQPISGTGSLKQRFDSFLEGSCQSGAFINEHSRPDEHIYDGFIVLHYIEHVGSDVNNLVEKVVQEQIVKPFGARPQLLSVFDETNSRNNHQQWWIHDIVLANDKAGSGCSRTLPVAHLLLTEYPNQDGKNSLTTLAHSYASASVSREGATFWKAFAPLVLAGNHDEQARLVMDKLVSSGSN